jgi:acetoin utilization deacetylase AcuC-like enzyme
MVEALLGGAAAAGVAIVRPPGHHARPDAAMGFCLVNNVAVAAAHARALGAERVLVLDWDVHHGNGTQEMFYADPSVLYVSLHQSPFYPGTGAASEVGAGDGRGYNVNVPLSEGADDAVYAAAFDRLILPIAGDYDPDLLLVSAGFDAHHRDPLAGMSLSQAAYGRMVQGLRSALRGGGQGRIGLVLEGGYDLGGLRDSLRAALEALSPDPAAAAPTPSPAAAISERHAAEIARSVAAHAPYWKLGTGAAR